MTEPSKPGPKPANGTAITVSGLLFSVLAAVMLGAAIIGSDPYRHVSWIEPVVNVAAILWFIGACSSLVGVIKAARART